MVGGTIHFKCQSLTSASLLDAAKENMYVLYPKMSYLYKTRGVSVLTNLQNDYNTKIKI